MIMTFLKLTCYSSIPIAPDIHTDTNSPNLKESLKISLVLDQIQGKMPSGPAILYSSKLFQHQSPTPSFLHLYVCFQYMSSRIICSVSEQVQLPFQTISINLRRWQTSEQFQEDTFIRPLRRHLYILYIAEGSSSKRNIFLPNKLEGFPITFPRFRNWYLIGVNINYIRNAMSTLQAGRVFSAIPSYFIKCISMFQDHMIALYFVILCCIVYSHICTQYLWKWQFS